MEFLIGVIIVLLLIGVGIEILKRIFEVISKRFGISSTTTYLRHVGGIPHLDQGADVSLSLISKTDEIHINTSHIISLNRVKRAECVEEHQLNKVQVSLIEQAVANGALLNSLSSFVSAMSGHGTHQREYYLQFLSIDYINRENEQQTALFLIPTVDEVRENRGFVNDVNKRVGYVPEKTNNPDRLNPYRL